MSDSVRSVARALEILLCFNSQKPSLSLTQIAEQIGMHKSTTHRLLATLEAKRFVTRDKASGMYQLGFRFIELASVMLQEIDINHWAEPYLQHLAQISGESVDLAVLDDGHVVYTQVIESPQRVKIAAAVGQQLPVHCTATGKAFLAYLPENQVQEILAKEMVKYTEHTLNSIVDMQQDLEKVRERGFSISKEEYEKDIHAVAAPILDGNGCPIAAIAIVGPSYRLSDDRMMMLGQAILETASTIAREIGLSALPAILPKTTSNYHEN